MVTSLRSKWAAGWGSVSAGRRIGVSAPGEVSSKKWINMPPPFPPGAAAYTAARLAMRGFHEA